MTAIRVSRPRSPSVAEELADLCAPNLDQLERAANRRATVTNTRYLDGAPLTRYVFEDGSCIQLFHDEVLILPNCEQE